MLSNMFLCNILYVSVIADVFGANKNKVQ